MYQNNIFQFWKLQYDSGFIKGISDNIFIFNSSWRQEFHLTFASAAAVQCTWYQFWSEETTKYQWRFFLTLKYTGLLSPSYLTVANTDALIWSSKSAVIQQSASSWAQLSVGAGWPGMVWADVRNVRVSSTSKMKVKSLAGAVLMWRVLYSPFRTWWNMAYMSACSAPAPGGGGHSQLRGQGESLHQPQTSSTN